MEIDQWMNQISLRKYKQTLNSDNNMNEAEFIENTDYLDAEYLEYAENVSTASTEDYNNNMDEAGFIENTDYFDT
ncbi:hypothetical protein C2G38_2205860 [Gigaspora rosea]|uniref:Uncharacterized protein n=1 Tax=Gigaspora rosea TaxID=44941 RepID=A0A397UM33_9GLOM|nr:hypothetical protein C2G38_2205860 [Gigaspora rosea]